MSPQRIQLSRRKGFRLPLNAKSVARPHRWGNPFKVIRSSVWTNTWNVVGLGESHLHRAKPEAVELAVELHRRWLIRELERGDWQFLEEFFELAGLDLACWCPVGSPCHADTLLWEVNR